MSKCGNCSGDCSHCSGCGAAMTLTEGEISFLQKLGQIAFAPVTRRLGEETPVYLGDEELPEREFSLILQCLERKGLISIDYDQPLKGFDYGHVWHRLYHGSMGLTQRGQQVLEMLEIQGIEA